MDTIERIIGHNAPPPDLIIGEALRDKLRDDHLALLRRRDELLAAADRIPLCTDEDAARKISDFVKQLTACAKAADAARVGVKEPYLEGGRVVDGWFKSIIDPLAAIKKNTEAKLTIYLRAKEAEERRRREDIERAAREQAERARKAAEDAARAMRDQQGLDTAVAAETASRAAEADAIKAEQAASVKAAEISQVRGEFGALSLLRTTWTFAAIDRATLDLEALRSHLPMDGIERAVRNFIKAGGRELRGTRIYETTGAVVR